MVTVGMQYRVVPEKQEEFVGVFDEILAAMKGTPGHHDTRLFREVGEPRNFYILSHWDTEDAYHAFVRGEAMDRILTGAHGKLLDGRPQHKVYYP